MKSHTTTPQNTFHEMFETYCRLNVNIISKSNQTIQKITEVFMCLDDLI